MNPLTYLAVLAVAGWHDPSPHRVRFVEVEPGIRLEVLDWGGPGRAVVLLAGAGNTAHVFDDFAPKLTDHWHVYGITRRGFGASSQPDAGYDDQRLADDVLRVLDSLGIEAPVLVGHSMAGGEMTTLARQHPNRISGLVFLDALGDPRDWSGSDPAYMALARALPASMRTPPPPPSGAEAKSFAGFREWELRNQKFAPPEAELRNQYRTNPDGTKGERISTQRIWRAIGLGQVKRDYSGIHVPVLALYPFIRLGSTAEKPEERAAIAAYNAATAVYVDRWNANLLSQTSDVHFVDMPDCGHYVFLACEARVLNALRPFLEGLPQ